MSALKVSVDYQIGRSPRVSAQDVYKKSGRGFEASSRFTRCFFVCSFRADYVEPIWQDKADEAEIKMVFLPLLDYIERGLPPSNDVEFYIQLSAVDIFPCWPMDIKAD